MGPLKIVKSKPFKHDQLEQVPKVVLDCALDIFKDGGFTASPWNSLAISIQFFTACLPALKYSFSYTAK